ncbi:hypothetical protein [Sinimarinibacterium flocculans]|uniref:hypothetical protein n=1 Tax=Sinimarinibacterium flocculans TaxID=985250 RepID=UPI003511F3F0
MNDVEKYVLEQAKIEVEHTRSWPTKILAFYVAINAGLVTTLFALAGRTSNLVTVPCWVKTVITMAVLCLLAWAFYLLQKNHRTYLAHRKLQVQFQQVNRSDIEKQLTPPQEWFADIDVRLGTRWQGWSFYFYLVVLVSTFSIVGVWAS